MIATPLETAIQKGGEFGFDHVEFLMEGDLDHRTLTDRCDEVSALASEHDVELLVHLPFHRKDRTAIGTSDSSVRERAIDEMKQCITVSRQLGARKGVLHVETDDAPHLAEQGDREVIVDVLGTLDGYAGERGFELCVENLPDRYPDLTELEYLLGHTDVSVTVDTGHARVNGNDADDVAAFVTEYIDRISHVHLNDTRDPVDEHLPFKAGTIDFDRILDPLRNGWNGTFSFEIRTRDFDYIRLSKQKLDEMI